MIELTNVEPPYFQEHKHFAYTKILENPPPVVTSKKWSHEFNEFISFALQKDPEYRWTADKLLSHPWLSNASDKKHEFIQ